MGMKLISESFQTGVNTVEIGSRPGYQLQFRACEIGAYVDIKSLSDTGETIATVPIHCKDLELFISGLRYMAELYEESEDSVIDTSEAQEGE
jgi:hypothetical protein